MTLELVEHVTLDGTVLDVVPRSEMRRRRLRHRCVYIAVVTSDARLVVHQRADWKDIWPGYWDIAFGGVVSAGESWDAAAARELAEEAGIGPLPTSLGQGAYEDEDVAVVARAYLVTWDGALTFADGEVATSQLVPLADLDRWLTGRRVCPDSVAIVRPLLP